jgi:hypothetical protein
MSNVHSPGLNAERPTRQRTSGVHIARDVLYPITWLFATVTWIVAAVNISNTERVGGYYYIVLVELLVAGLLTSIFTIPLFIIFRRPTTNTAVLKMRWAEILLLSIFAALFLGGTASTYPSRLLPSSLRNLTTSPSSSALTRRRRSIFWFLPTIPSYCHTLPVISPYSPKVALTGCHSLLNLDLRR